MSIESVLKSYTQPYSGGVAKDTTVARGSRDVLMASWHLMNPWGFHTGPRIKDLERTELIVFMPNYHPMVAIDEYKRFLWELDEITYAFYNKLWAEIEEGLAFIDGYL